VLDTIDEECMKKLEEMAHIVYKPKDLQGIEGADVLIVRSTKVGADIIDKAKTLKVIARAGVGTDNIDLEACEKRNIKVINTPDAPTNSVAELTIGLMICMLRKVVAAHNSMKNKLWRKNELLGNELNGKTLGIIGLGRIGRTVAKLAKSFGMNVIAYDPNVKNDEHANLVTLDALLANSDVITIHASLTPKTEKMINANTIQKMKEGVILLNLSRGKIIDEDALYQALTTKKISMAALDVFDVEPYNGKLIELDNVILTPHLGSNTAEAQARIGDELIERLKEVIRSA
jgi:D-3-phosphoglycerate dehydrogenase